MRYLFFFLSTTSFLFGLSQNIIDEYDDVGRLIRRASIDNSVNYVLQYSPGKVTISNQNTGEKHYRGYGADGKLQYEQYSNGLKIGYSYSGNKVKQIILPDSSMIEYKYLGYEILSVTRKKRDGTSIYTHEFNQPGQETLIGNLGKVETEYDPEWDIIHIDSSFGNFSFRKENKGLSFPTPNQSLGYDTKGRIVRDGIRAFEYDALDRLISYSHDNLKIEFTYDILGRRLSKKVSLPTGSYREFFLSYGLNEVGIYRDDLSPKHLRIPGRFITPYTPIAVAVETNGKVFAPIYNPTFHVLKLVNLETIKDYTNLDLSGKNLDTMPYSPWVFSTKTYDQESGLVFFGKRWYDPKNGIWLTPDREGHDKGLQYVRNQPTKYFDPDGQCSIVVPIWGVGAAITGASLSPLLAGGALALSTGYVSYKVIEECISIHREYKQKKAKVSGKEGSKNVPSWVKGSRPYKGESGKDFAKRLMDEKYGKNKYNKGPRTEYNQIRKWGDRSWQ